MIFEIPIDASSERQTFDVELDGATYALELTYSARVDQWFASLYFRSDSTLVPILTGAGVVANYPLLAGVRHADRPPGELSFDGEIEPGRTQLGALVKLRYRDAAEG
jgi:hypothetical protein